MLDTRMLLEHVNTTLPAFWNDTSVTALICRVNGIARSVINFELIESVVKHPLMSRISCCFEGFDASDYQTRLLALAAAPFKLNTLANTLISECDYSISATVIKNFFSAFVYQLVKKELNLGPYTRKTFAAIILPLIFQKCLEQGIVIYLSELYEICDEQSYFEIFKDAYDAFATYFPNMADIMEHPVTSVGFDIGKIQILDTFGEESIKLFQNLAQSWTSTIL